MKEDSRFAILLVTAPAGGAGERIARALVERRLAACVNRAGNVQSVYRWKGNVESDSEELLIIKTRRDAIPRIEELLNDLHPYDVPELLALPIDGGSGPYLDWLEKSLRAPDDE